MICDTTVQSEVQSEELLELVNVFVATAAAVALLCNESTPVIRFSAVRLKTRFTGQELSGCCLRKSNRDDFLDGLQPLVDRVASSAPCTSCTSLWACKHVSRVSPVMELVA